METTDQEIQEVLDTAPQTTFDIARRLYIRKKIEEQIEAVEQQRDEAEKWYHDKITRLNMQIDLIEAYIKAYLEASDQKSIPTPNGTAYLVTADKYEWPDTNTLINFATQNYPDALVLTTDVSRAQLKDYIKSTGNMPTGMSVTKQTRLQIRGKES